MSSSAQLGLLDRGGDGPGNKVAQKRKEDGGNVNSNRPFTASASMYSAVVDSSPLLSSSAPSNNRNNGLSSTEGFGQLGDGYGRAFGNGNESPNDLQPFQYRKLYSSRSSSSVTNQNHTNPSTHHNPPCQTPATHTHIAENHNKSQKYVHDLADDPVASMNDDITPSDFESGNDVLSSYNSVQRWNVETYFETLDANNAQVSENASASTPASKKLRKSNSARGRNSRVKSNIGNDVGSSKKSVTSLNASKSKSDAIGNRKSSDPVKRTSISSDSSAAALKAVTTIPTVSSKDNLNELVNMGGHGRGLSAVDDLSAMYGPADSSPIPAYSVDRTSADEIVDAACAINVQQERDGLLHIT